MRLDLFLKSSRLISRRSLAQEFCEKGLVEVNGAAAKASKEIKAGDEVTIRRSNRITVVAVEQIPSSKQVSKSQAAGLYQTVRDEAISDESL